MEDNRPNQRIKSMLVLSLGSESSAQSPRRCYHAGGTRRQYHGKTAQLPHVFCVRRRQLHRARWGTIGLHLRFYTDDEGRCIARFRPKPEHQGFPGQLHGGIVSTLLDEPSQIP
jgi:hypothetical protein